MKTREEILDEMLRVTAAFVPELPKRKHWWSLPHVAVTTSETMAPLDAKLIALLTELNAS